MIEPKNWIDEVWNTELYQQLKRENFELVDKYLPSSPLKILDIGCGLAWESRMFSQKYGTELYLLDGDVSANKDKTLALARDTEYHASADNFLFYNKLEEDYIYYHKMRSFKDNKELNSITSDEKKIIKQQAVDVFKVLGLTSLSILPGGTLIFILLRVFKQEDKILPSSFLTEEQKNKK